MDRCQDADLTTGKPGRPRTGLWDRSRAFERQASHPTVALRGHVDVTARVGAEAKVGAPNRGVAHGFAYQGEQCGRGAVAYQVQLVDGGGGSGVVVIRSDDVNDVAEEESSSYDVAEQEAAE